MPVRETYVKADPSPQGWGVAKDPVAARQYYETAANLGDTDAMEEAAWCYLEGFGGAKDKVRTLFSHIIVYSAPALISPLVSKRHAAKHWARLHYVRNRATCVTQADYLLSRGRRSAATVNMTAQYSHKREHTKSRSAAQCRPLGHAATMQQQQ